MKKIFVKPEDVDTYICKPPHVGTLKMLCEPAVTDTQRVFFEVATYERDAVEPTHGHPDLEEIIYVLSGEGEQTVGEDRRKITPGMMVYIPPGVEHETKNIGWRELSIIVIYVGEPDAIDEITEEHKVLPILGKDVHHHPPTDSGVSIHSRQLR